MKLGKNQNYNDAEHYMTKNGKAIEKLIEKLKHACSGDRFDIVFHAVGNLLAFEIAHRIDADQHQEFIKEFINWLAQNLTEGVQSYLPDEQMLAASGTTNLQELTKHMN